MNDYWDTSMPKSPPPWILNPLAGGRYKGCSHRFHRRMYYSMSTMSDSFAQRHDALIHTDDDPAEIDLRNPLWAAFWALLWPGSGHIYQRRYSKGILFMVCILLLFVTGWNLGGEKVVYASWRDNDHRWQYFCQFWVGIPAWPAILQTANVTPFGKDFMRRPAVDPQVDPQWFNDQVNHDQPTEAALWQLNYHGDYELGTILTMIAGLLNLLVIFDAAAGPVHTKKTQIERGKENIDHIG